jgi:hypothetical protein
MPYRRDPKDDVRCRAAAATRATSGNRAGASNWPGWVSFRGFLVAIVLAAAFAGARAARAQPADAPVVFEGGVVNAANFVPPPLAGSGLAQGSLISIFGSNLGPEPGVSAEFPLASELAGVSIEIQTADRGVLAAIPLFVSSGQINALLPSATPVGLNALSVRRGGVSGGFTSIKVVRGGFGLFASGSGVVRTAAAQRFVSPIELPLVTREAPARPGDAVVLWGTGLGPVAGPETAAAEAGSLDTPIEVMVGHRSAAILYQGRSPCCVGLDQVNVRIPDDAPAGCFVPVWVSMRGSLHSNIAAIPISADGGACRESPSLPAPLPGASAGSVLLRRAVELDEALNPDEATAHDLAVGLFRMLPEAAEARAAQPVTWEPAATAGRAARNLGLAPLQAADLPAVPPEGTCLVYGAGVEEGSSVGDALLLDAGARLELDGPLGRVEVPRGEAAYRLAAPPEALFLGAGFYRLQGPGGNAFPPFSAVIASGEATHWTAKGDGEGEARVRGLAVGWAPQATPADSILLVGRDVIAVPGGSGAESLAPARFVCAVAESDAGFVIPPAVLANLPEATAGLDLTSVWGPRALEFATDGPEAGSLAYVHAWQSSVRTGQAQLPSTPVELPDGVEVQAELAATFAERQRGLMFRRELPPSQGMLFLFENPGRYGFWMLNTLVPLDIVWLDSERRVVFVSQNTPPCPPGTLCPTYGSDVVAQFVLELAAGEAAAHGLTNGTRVEW